MWVRMRRGKSKGERKTKEKGTEDDEVEQMLRAAQDEILLNLSINSHLARASPSSTTDLHPNSDPGLDSVLDPDLERRFQALKMKNKAHQPVVEEQDLSARFDALKAKFNPPVDPTVTSSKTQSRYEEGEESEEDEETQVQKLIEWAKDAARLDPSPPSESDDDDDDDDDHHHHR